MFLMPDNKWARLLAYVTGLVNQKLLLRNEYLAAENRILRAHLPARIRLSGPERSTLAAGLRSLSRFDPRVKTPGPNGIARFRASNARSSSPRATKIAACS